jgi:hypothetical protein
MKNDEGKEEGEMVAPACGEGSPVAQIRSCDVCEWWLCIFFC